MASGAALHVHDTALASAAWVVQELTYWPNLYMCYDTSDQLFFRYNKHLPKKVRSSVNQLVSWSDRLISLSVIKLVN